MRNCFGNYKAEMLVDPLQAVQKDPNFAKNLGQLVVLGGAFNACGNVNPAAEANVSLTRQKSHSRNVRITPLLLHHLLLFTRREFF